MAMNKKDELRKQLAEIEEREHAAMIAEHYPEFWKLVGKCFRVRNNYSCPEKPEDYWWLYRKVIDIKPDDLYASNGKTLARCRVFEFENDKYGAITIWPVHDSYVHSLGKPISNELFDEEYEKLINELTGLKHHYDSNN